MFYLYVNKYMAKSSHLLKLFWAHQTANVAYFPRKIKLSAFSAYSDGSPSQLTFWRRNYFFKF